MKPSLKLATTALLLMSLPAVAVAHPGHGRHAGDHSPWHYLTEPQHFLVVGGLLIAGAAVYVAGKVVRWVRPAADNPS